MNSPPYIHVLGLKAEEKFGIRADTGDLQKFHSYITEKYGRADEEIIDRVFRSGEAAEFLTVNETYFFREPAHFLFFRGLLPSYEKTGLRVCCAAVSSGCEAYSIAMLLENYNKSAVKPVVWHIDAFDINPKMIEAANKGIFSERTLREDGKTLHYLAGGYLGKPEKQNEGCESAFGHSAQFRIDLNLKKNINFFVHNLMDKFPAENYDIVFFRNAYIYLTQKSRERILGNIAAALKEEGILVMGVSETAGVQHSGIKDRNLNDVFYFTKT